MTFDQELEQLVNRYSIENESDTPDWILAKYIRGCLDAWNASSRARDQWYGFNTLGGNATLREAAIMTTKWITCFNGGVEWFDTSGEAIAAAEKEIAFCRESGEWDDAVESIVVAKVTHAPKCCPDLVGPEGHLQTVNYILKEVNEQDA